jgi:hypothetical protein
VPKYVEFMSWADLEGLRVGDGDREALLSGESELADSRWCRLDLGRGESDFGESGMDSGDACGNEFGRTVKVHEFTYQSI